MKLTKCSNNHYYNADKLPYCPHCINIETGVPLKNLSGMNQADVGTESAEHIVESTDSFQRKTVGWLVCVEGNMVGESFILYDRENYIGRSPNMNICLSKEPTVSRDNHACITYDKNTNCLSITPGVRNYTVLLNDLLLTDTQPLSDRNLIQLGDCVLLYVALCDKNFSWSYNNH